MGTDLGQCDFVNLQQAISSAASGDVLQVAATTFLGAAGTNFNVTAKSLTIRGGYDAACTGARGSSPTLVQGGGGDSVVEIGGSASGNHFVHLDQVLLSHGASDADHGGGIGIAGDFDVTLTDVTIENSASEKGGGIFVDGSFGATLYLENTTIRDNTATVDGGGIYCTEGAELRLESGVSLLRNHAGVDGGGLWSSGCTVRLGGVAIEENTAGRNGGGLFASALTDLYSLEGGDRGHVDRNQAGFGGSGFGGGIYATGGSATGIVTEVQLRAYTSIGNRATVGGAVYAADGAYVDLAAEGPAAWNLVSGNAAVLGTAFAAVDDADVVVRGRRVERNGDGAASGPLLYATADGQIELANVVVFGNVDESATPGPAVYATGGRVDLVHCSVVGQRGHESFFGEGGEVYVKRSLFQDNDGELFASGWSGTGAFDCAVVPTGATVVVPSTSLFFGDPLLVDPSSGDLHLQPGSPAIDLCPEGFGNLDIDGDPRPQGAAWDAGADEHLPALFADGFETGSTSAWSGGSP